MTFYDYNPMERANSGIAAGCGPQGMFHAFCKHRFIAEIDRETKGKGLLFDGGFYSGRSAYRCRKGQSQQGAYEETRIEFFHEFLTSNFALLALPPYTPIDLRM